MYPILTIVLAITGHITMAAAGLQLGGGPGRRLTTADLEKCPQDFNAEAYCPSNFDKSEFCVDDQFDYTKCPAKHRRNNVAISPRNSRPDDSNHDFCCAYEDFDSDLLGAGAIGQNIEDQGLIYSNWVPIENAPPKGFGSTSLGAISRFNLDPTDTVIGALDPVTITAGEGVAAFVPKSFQYYAAVRSELLLLAPLGSPKGKLVVTGATAEGTKYTSECPFDKSTPLLVEILFPRDKIPVTCEPKFPVPVRSMSLQFVVDDPSANYLRELLKKAGADGVEAVNNFLVGFWFDNLSRLNCRV
ncbi:hypothetical protein PspLS_04253 [Pyricularia sp. CBS 133598]|nr:hypothetical protein PspLS_04253 [Pyricularia sp. CBS 133598]